MPFGYYYFDPSFIILIPGLIIALYAQFKISSTFNKYSKRSTAQGQTGAQVARRILDANGLSDVPVESVSGSLSDHYDPSKRMIRLSEDVYNKTSVAAIGVAAHECGHALQHQQGYAPLKIRHALVPIVNIASYASFIFLIIGMFLNAFGLVWVGIALFSASVIFQLVTLPVEFNASSRALAQLDDLGLTTSTENNGAKKVLKAAALTYVAGTIMAILQLLRFVMIFASNRD